MGWSGGTEIFDGALDTFLSFVPEDSHQDLIEKWYKVFEDTDWDTEDESKYWDKLELILQRNDSEQDWEEAYSERDWDNA